MEAFIPWPSWPMLYEECFDRATKIKIVLYGWSEVTVTSVCTRGILNIAYSVGEEVKKQGHAPDLPTIRSSTREPPLFSSPKYNYFLSQLSRVTDKSVKQF